MYVLDCIIGIYVPLRNNEGNQVRASLACWGLKTKLTAAWARASRLSEPHFHKTLSVLQKKHEKKKTVCPRVCPRSQLLWSDSTSHKLLQTKRPPYLKETSCDCWIGRRLNISLAGPLFHSIQSDQLEATCSVCIQDPYGSL